MYINPVTLSNQSTPAPELILLTPEQEAMYLQYNGFIKVTNTNPIEIEPDTEAYEAWKTTQPNPIDSIRESKLIELSNACNDAINAGTQVQLSDGSTESFTYDLADQANVSEMFTAVMAGATEYPYHQNGGDCKMYSAQDIVKIYSSLSGMKTGQITYQNQLKQYVKAMTNVDDVYEVSYGQELTGEYLEKYNTLIAQAQEQMQTVLSKMMG